jgi:hypothetical protein
MRGLTEPGQEIQVASVERTGTPPPAEHPSRRVASDDPPGQASDDPDGSFLMTLLRALGAWSV